MGLKARSNFRVHIVLKQMEKSKFKIHLYAIFILLE